MSGADCHAVGRNIYLDHNATTPPATFIRENVPEWVMQWGNPNSIHHSGRGPKKLIREARKQFAALIKCRRDELIFCASGTEANNLALQGMVEWSLKKKRTEWILSSIEHPSVAQTAAFLEERGINVLTLPVHRNGGVNLSTYCELLSKQTGLVSVMAANNETGNILPVSKLAALAHECGAFMHSDAVQLLGKAAFSCADLNADMLSFSGHKFYSLRGAGVLYVRSGCPLKRMIHGGAQELQRRAGTEDVLAITSLGSVAARAGNLEEMIAQTAKMRDEMELRIIEEIPSCYINGVSSPRVCNTSNMLIADVDGESLLMAMDIAGFSLSTGSACASGKPDPSPVLLAMGLSDSEARSSLRISLGFGTTAEELDQFVDCLKETVKRLRKYHG